MNSVELVLISIELFLICVSLFYCNPYRRSDESKTIKAKETLETAFFFSFLRHKGFPYGDDNDVDDVDDYDDDNNYPH